MIVLDASVLIAQLDRTDAVHRQAEALLLEIGEIPLAASTVTLAEVMVGPARSGRLPAARAALRDLAVDEIAVPAGAANRLAEIQADTGLKLPDCCVLLAAEEISAEAVLTFDDRLAVRAHQLGYGWDTGP